MVENNIQEVEILDNQEPEDTRARFSSAAENRDLEGMRFLLDVSNEQVLSLGFKGRILREMTGKGYVDLVRCLLEHPRSQGISAEHKGWALCFAVHGRHVETVQFLLDHTSGQVISTEDKGWALCDAARDGYVEIVQLILEHPAGAAISTEDKRQAWCMALQQRHFFVLGYLALYFMGNFCSECLTSLFTVCTRNVSEAVPRDVQNEQDESYAVHSLALLHVPRSTQEELSVEHTRAVEEVGPSLEYGRRA